MIHRQFGKWILGLGPKAELRALTEMCQITLPIPSNPFASRRLLRCNGQDIPLKRHTSPRIQYHPGCQARDSCFSNEELPCPLANMQSGKRPMNCLPCAKRKVRCDKRQPCCHCRRRSGDVCVYPGEGTIKSDGRPEDYSQRIDKLEAYVRRLGGDPQLVGQIIKDGENHLEQSGTRNASTGSRGVGMIASPGRSGSEDSRMKRTDRHTGTQAGLVEHDEQVTYIDQYVIIRFFVTVKTLLTATCQTDVV